MRRITPAETGNLETLIDSCGMANVLLKLAEIAEEKADHVRSTYNDAALADHWKTAAGNIAKAAYSSSISD